jgi:hypothetical protein
VEENPNRRRFSGPKKEENFSAKCWKKIHRKKIHFLTGGFDPLPFQRWHRQNSVGKLESHPGKVGHPRKRVLRRRQQWRHEA